MRDVFSLLRFIYTGTYLKLFFLINYVYLEIIIYVINNVYQKNIFKNTILLSLLIFIIINCSYTRYRAGNPGVALITTEINNHAFNKREQTF